MKAAERLAERADLSANLEPTDCDYLAACRNAERSTRDRARRTKALVGALAAGVLAVVSLAYGGFLEPTYLEGRVNGIRNSMREPGLKPGDTFSECAKGCPEVVVVPAGEFMMGSPDEQRRRDDEHPQHKVTIAKPFIVSKYEVTFDEWDACVVSRGCSYRPDDNHWGRGRQPVINVNWHEVQQYVQWLSRKTGKTYRLLSEAEWEYAARGITENHAPITEYFWGGDFNTDSANCDGCGSRWDNRQTAPVGSFKPNGFGLYDMHGNVKEWAEDPWHKNYWNAPTDGSAWEESGDPDLRVERGGSWSESAETVRSAFRFGQFSTYRSNDIGFRVARTLKPSNP